MLKYLFVLGTLASVAALAEPISAPGDLRLRHDLQLLNDAGLIDVPLTAWPIALGDINKAVGEADLSRADDTLFDALTRVRDHLAWELEVGTVRVNLRAAGAQSPSSIRIFQTWPRDEGEVSAGLSWFGQRFALNLAATAVVNPLDGENFRPDGTYAGVVLGNWMLTAGWQDRWWGPGRDGSLILGTNARPTPGIGIQRNISEPFETRWLSWLGPWTLTAFISELDDDRVIRNAWLFGVRGSFRPPKTGLEIGISRTAQWCGDGRPCTLETFGDLLLGNDNRGVNVDADEEPGNQLGGIDIRWKLPGKVPVAAYMQWIGEDGRSGGGAIGSWMRQIGLEYWGHVGALSHRTHLEVSDSMCREGSLGFSDKKPDCGYEHGIYQTGYRYLGRSLGHPADGDSRSYSLGSTLVQSDGHVWNVTLRHMEINREGGLSARHTLFVEPHKLVDIQVSHQRRTRFGTFLAGLGYSRLTDQVTNVRSSEAAGYLQWSSH